MTDAPPSQTPTAQTATPKPLAIASGFLLPLFFVIVFPLMFVGAVHKPTAHDVPVLIVGPEQVVADVAGSLDDTEQFAATQSDVPGSGRTSVENREVDGAIEVTVAATDTAATAPDEADPAVTVTTFVAGAGGAQVSATIQAAGDEIAEQLGTTATVEDVAPLAGPDALGTNLFYLLTYTSLAAYLVIIVLMQVKPSARLTVRFAAITAAAIAAPLIVFGLSSIFVGDYGASFGTIAGLLGVNALYVFTVGSAAILIEQLLGKAATFGVMGFIVFLNFPSAGGATPGSLLPPFWQAIHHVYFGSGAYESFRSIVYFDGNGTARWLFQLLAWTVGLVLVNGVVYQTKKEREQRRTIADLEAIIAGPRSEGSTGAHDSTPTGEAGTHKHLRIENLTYEDEHPGPENPARRSITAGEGAAR